MDDPVTGSPLRRSLRLGWLTFFVIVALLVAIVAAHRHEQRQQAEEMARVNGLVTVLSSTFSRASALKVGEVSGWFDVTSVDPGVIPLLRSAQKVKLPYTIDYSVDLSHLTASNYRWDKRSRTLVVDAPDVAIGQPNIDEARRQTLATTGLFVTRGAADNLSRRAAAMSNRAAANEARKPEHLGKARDNARNAIATMLRAPLDVAGLGDVRVVVRFPEDGQPVDRQWDISPSIAEVLARARNGTY